MCERGIVWWNRSAARAIRAVRPTRVYLLGGGEAWRGRVRGGAPRARRQLCARCARGARARRASACIHRQRRTAPLAGARGAGVVARWRLPLAFAGAVRRRSGASASGRWLLGVAAYHTSGNAPTVRARGRAGRGRWRWRRVPAGAGCVRCGRGGGAAPRPAQPPGGGRARGSAVRAGAALHAVLRRAGSARRRPPPGSICGAASRTELAGNECRRVLGLRVRRRVGAE